MDQQIADKKRRTPGRRKTDPLYEAFFQALPQPAVIVDDNYIILAANRAYCELLKATPDRIIGHSSAEFMDAKVSLASYTEFNSFKERGTWTGTWSVRSLDGQIHELEWTAIANFYPGHHCSIGRKLGSRNDKAKQ
jgi:PAS domain S-box-containing protein